MTPARVYLVVWWFDRFGGMERHVTDLAIALSRRGVEVTVFSEMPLPDDNRYGRELRDAGVEVLAPERRAWTGSGLEDTRLYRLLAGLDREPSVTWIGQQDEYLRHQHVSESTRDLLETLERRAAQTPPDVVHVHACRLAQHRVLQWASARGYPTVHTEHVTISDWGGPFDPESPWIVAGAADAIACVSAYSRDSLMALLPAPREIHVARHIIGDPQLADPTLGTPRRRPEGAPVSLLAVGRLATHKGYATLLQAVARLRDEGVPVRLAIAGEGEQRAELEALRQALDLAESVAFLGQLDPSQVAELWKAADIGVAPSLTEGLPLSIVEAMAQARPIVASRVGGIPEIILDGETGLLAPPGDAAAFAAAIGRVIRDPALAERLARGARRSFEGGGWSEAAVTDQALAIYAQAARSRAAKAEQEARDPLDWAQARARRDAEGLGPVCLFAWRLSAFGDMEYALAQQASALAGAGVAVSLFVHFPVSPFNVYVRNMRRAGVRVRAPSLPGFVGARLRSRLRGERAGGALARRLARAWARERPGIVQVHGWRLRCDGFSAVLDLAAAMEIPAIYTEHAHDGAADEGDPVAMARFARLSAASAAAADYLASKVGARPVSVFRHVGARRPPAAGGGRPAGAPFKVFSLSPVALSSSVATDPALIEVIAAGACADVYPQQLDECDAALLSAAAEGFGVALTGAMAGFKPVIVRDASGSLPIRHGANGLRVEGDPAAAVMGLASDPLLARQFAVAARRTYETDGLRDLAIVSELMALYDAAARTGEDAHARG